MSCPCFEEASPCFCGPLERLLRAHTNPAWEAPPLSEEQRGWCVREIRSIEGWTDYQPPADDAGLARDVLEAWRDYARDKGLI